MKRALLFLVLLSSVALAQPVPPSGNCGGVSAACRSSQFRLLAGAKLEFNYSTNTTWINASTTTAGMVLNSGVANSGTNAAYIFDTTNALTGTTRLATFRNGGVLKLAIDATGQILGTFATPQFINMSYGANGIQLATGSSGGGDIAFTDQGSNVFAIAEINGLRVPSGKGYGVNNSTGPAQGMTNSGVDTYISGSGDGSAVHLRAGGTGTIFATAKLAGIITGNAGNPVPVIHAAQTTAAQAMEYGKTAATGGALAVTFATAFASAPTCNCTHEAAVPLACGITTAANTTSVTFTAGAGTDVINWICIGAK